MDFDALFKISYGLYVVTAHDNARGYAGCVANTFMQVTSAPVKVAMSISKNNQTHEFIKNTMTFNCNVLRRDADINDFSKFGYRTGREIDKFEDEKVSLDINGNPELGQHICLASFVCWVTETVDLGTHTLFIAIVDDAKIIDNTAEVMTYDSYRKEKKLKPPPNAPTYMGNR